MAKQNDIVLKGTTTYFEKVDLETSQRMKNGELVFLNMPLPVGCNYRCPKCFTGGSDIYEEQLRNRRNTSRFSPQLRRRLIRESYDLGAKTMIIAGAGEPLIYPEVGDVLETTAEVGMGVVLFTNGSSLSEEKSREYFSKGVSLVFSLDALSEESYDRLTGTTGNYDTARRNLEFALKEAEKHSHIKNCCKVVPLAVNTNLTNLTYNPNRGIDEISRIKDLIAGRVPHYVSHITPTGQAKKHWDSLVGTDDFSPNPILKEGERRYSNGLGGGSGRRKNKQCAYIHNGVAVYEGHYMMCPNVGLIVDWGRFPEVTVQEYFEAKKRRLDELGNPSCVTRR